MTEIRNAANPYLRENEAFIHARAQAMLPESYRPMRMPSKRWKLPMRLCDQPKREYR